MNKEEIEKAMKVVFNETCKECYFPKKRKCTNCIKENGKKIKDYIQHLEQKETILDKVTDKLKEDAREEEGYIKWLDERTKEIVQPKKTIIVKSDYARSILSIIEGEKE